MFTIKPKKCSRAKRRRRRDVKGHAVVRGEVLEPTLVEAHLRQETIDASFSSDAENEIRLHNYMISIAVFTRNSKKRVW